MTTSPAKAQKAIEAIRVAMTEVAKLETQDDSFPVNVYNTLFAARQELAKYVSTEWDKSRTMESGAD